MIGLVDCNNFFVSCERVFHPELEQKPVVVLSNNDGYIISRSNEAKQLGIKMVVPRYQVEDIIRKYNVQVFSGNYKLYGDMSARVMSVLRQENYAIEIYSIDEAFIDFSNEDTAKLKEQGEKLVKQIRQATGIPVSLGIAPSKVLAKVASRLCKEYPRLNGCCFMHHKADIEKILKNTPIGEIWGIGSRLDRQLREAGILTAADFCEKNELWVRQRMGVVGVRLQNELKGISCMELNDQLIAKKQIRVSRTFPYEFYHIQELRSAFLSFALRCMEKLRSQHSCCARVTIYLHTNTFKENSPQYHHSKEIRFITPTDSSLEINSAIIKVLEELYIEGYGYKKGGVILDDFVPSNEVQGSLFDSIDRVKHKQLMQTIDQLNHLFGKGTISVAALSIDPTEQMNRSFLSPEYTTKLDDILTIKL